MAKAFRLSLEFRFIDCACKRTLVVPARANFDDLHNMIQACNNWMNYHLYNFELSLKGKHVRIEPLWQQVELEKFDDIPSVCSDEVRLSDAFSAVRLARYSYDYGDGWEIDIKVTEEMDVPLKSLPYCANGEGDCPPEDVGGEGGFLEFQRIAADFEDPEHEYMVNWAEGQGFERFNIDACNQRLSSWEDLRAEVSD